MAHQRQEEAARAGIKPYYEHGGITIYHGDCREVMAGLERVDHVITDPPYDEWTHSRGGGWDRRDGGPQLESVPFAPLQAIGSLAMQMASICSRWSMVFCAVRQIEEWATSYESAGVNIVRVMAWVKPDASPQFSGDRPGHGWEAILLTHPVGKTRWNGGGHKGVFIVSRMDRDSGWLHPTQKPIVLLQRLVSLFTDSGDLILDPFMGSGTTLRAAKDLGRRAIGIEIEERYCEIAAKRMEQEVLPLVKVSEPVQETFP